MSTIFISGMDLFVLAFIVITKNEAVLLSNNFFSSYWFGGRDYGV
ncbi:hypothetical protein [Legionella sp. 227]